MPVIASHLHAWRRNPNPWLGPATLALLAGCNPAQSVLHPAGEDAAEIARLFWVMAVGAVVIWAVVFGAAVFAIVSRRKPTTERGADLVVLFGGVVFPTVTLGALLAYGLTLLPDWGPGEPPDLRVHVEAEQYWWRVRIEGPDGAMIETANEVVLPAGAEVDFHLTSPDVIHSFWIPPLGGKMDTIPGRENVLRLRPTTPGLYRGICAEFCGASHAFMAFEARVVPPEDFTAYLAAQAEPASGDASAFVAAGCGGCHTVRGVVELGATGPDLTHFASRATIAGILDNTSEILREWIAHPVAFKPDARMPSYDMLTDDQMDAILAFLGGLK
ncbi:cytochrome c oxidase subunit II [Silicimonas algicola]|uniref:Cytochrome aa3 subunit 2 n=1 Tax=Silicimonas algicola TaxID=1826607 RepID=A0A316GLU1_9RHOB|nr:cytochrome c oxidase subunit II [Silicimonas algicola]PWK55817.1 cytochrome c oxidase subunit 2 [Silicimonas algicola]